MVEITNWFCKTMYSDPYLAPEQNPICIGGIVFGHPSQPDGKCVATSRVVGVEGRVVETLSRKYRLGNIDPEYRKWLRKNRPNWDWRNPVTMIERGEGNNGSNSGIRPNNSL